MTVEEAVSRLRVEIPALHREFGVRSLALFGSFARGDARPDSDVDVLVDFEHEARVTLITLGRLLDRLTLLLGRRVDLVENHPGLGDSFRAAIKRDLRRVA